MTLHRDDLRAVDPDADDPFAADYGTRPVTDTEVMQALGAARKWVCWEGFPYETCSPDNPRGCQFPEDCGWHWTLKGDDQ